jgi:hypothetical protein
MASITETQSKGTGALQVIDPSGQLLKVHGSDKQGQVVGDGGGGGVGVLQSSESGLRQQMSGMVQGGQEPVLASQMGQT